MSRLDDLPPDQRAALSLLLRQRKSYAEVAAMLGISERAAHDRAHAALAVLAPAQARGVASEGRQQIGDYLLGQQQGVAERLATRTYLSGSEPGRAWAQRIADELTSLASAPLPEIPAGAAPAAGAPPLAGATRPAAAARSTQSAASVREQLSSLQASGQSSSSAFAAPSSSSPLPSSRLGGALLLAIVAVVIVVVILLTSGGGSSNRKTVPSTTASTTSSTSTTATNGAGAGPTVTQKLALKSPDAKSRSAGTVEVLTEAGKRAFYISAVHIPASKHFFYAIWLYNSPTSSLPLSKSPPVGKNHRLAGGALLPSNAGEFHEILVTRETSEHPTRPGHVVLRGTFSLGS